MAAFLSRRKRTCALVSHDVIQDVYEGLVSKSMSFLRNQMHVGMLVANNLHDGSCRMGGVPLTMLNRLGEPGQAATLPTFIHMKMSKRPTRL